MNVKITQKNKIAGILIITILIFGGIALTLVQGDQPENPGQPPSGLLSEIYEALDILEADLINLQGQIDTVWVEMDAHVAGFNVAIGNLQNDLANLQNDLQNQINQLYNEDLMEIWNHLDVAIPNLQGQIDDIRFDIGVLFDALNSANELIGINWNAIGNIEARIDSFQTQIGDIHVDLAGLGDGLHLVNTEAIPTIWDDIDNNIHPRINELYEHISQIYNEFHVLRTVDLIEIWNQIESDRENLWDAINSIGADLENQITLLGEEVSWQVADIRDLIAFIDNDIRSDITLLSNDIQELWTHIDNVEANLQNQINNLNTRTPQTDIIQIPAAALTAVDHHDNNNYQYGNVGWKLGNDAIFGLDFVAPVCLPNGVEVLSLTMYANHEQDVNDMVRCTLEKVEVNSESETMAFVGSSNIGGTGSFYTDIITSPNIDYSQYCYFLRVQIPVGLAFCYVNIEYEYPA